MLKYEGSEQNICLEKGPVIAMALHSILSPLRVMRACSLGVVVVALGD